MTALSQDRATSERDGRERSFTVATGSTIYAGSLVMLDGSTVKPGAVASSKIAVGRAENPAKAGETIKVRRGMFRWSNDTANGGNLRTQDIGTNAYMLDDQTVSRISTGRSIAGKVFDVEDSGVWVETT